MTKDELLARVANAYDCGLLSPERLKLLERWLDFVMRFEGGQLSTAVTFLESERERLAGFNPKPPGWPDKAEIERLTPTPPPPPPPAKYPPCCCNRCRRERD